MKEPRMITRHANFARTGSADAGVYADGLNTVIISGPFELVIKGIYCGWYAVDSVTGMAIGAQVKFPVPWDTKYDNPGFSSVYNGRELYFGTGRVDYYPFHIVIPPLTTLTFAITMNFEQVTANSITTKGQIGVEYNCPKDFLSVDAFASPAV